MTKMHQDDTNAISLLLKSGLSHLNNNEIESAIQEFQLAEDIDPNNTEVLAIYILALSIDCEQNDRNCDNALKFYYTLKKLNESEISEDLKIRMIIVEEKLLHKR